MKIQYISDIHLEFLRKPPKIKVEADILVLAGDIGYPYSGIYREFLIDMNKKFKRVYLITGNHEYYNCGKNMNASMEEIDEEIIRIIKNNNLNNICYLDNSYDDYEGYRFVGLTLWSKINNSLYLINDFTKINEMNVELYNDLHEIGCEFLDYITKEVSSKPIIIITHHIPSYNLIDPVFRTEEYNKYNQCFASNCEKYFREPIKVWIYGHTHRNRETEINGIKFLCNPKGYPSENKNIILNKIVDV
jgi:predicted phosphodiesterase